MSTQSYDLLKISWNLFNENYWKLTDQQKAEVWDIYYDFY